LVAVLDTGESRGQLAVGSALGDPVEGADGGGEGGVEPVALRERGLQDVGQVIGAKAVVLRRGGGTAKVDDDLIHAELDAL
jgi:hypothetical protein